MQGTITVTARNAVRVQTYTAPDEGFLVTTHVIELPTQLVVIDSEYALPYAEEVLDYAEGLNKPIARLHISHEHPDHFFGAGVFGVPVYAPSTTSTCSSPSGRLDKA